MTGTRTQPNHAKMIIKHIDSGLLHDLNIKSINVSQQKNKINNDDLFCESIITIQSAIKHAFQFKIFEFLSQEQEPINCVIIFDDLEMSFCGCLTHFNNKYCESSLIDFEFDIEIISQINTKEQQKQRNIYEMCIFEIMEHVNERLIQQ